MALTAPASAGLTTTEGNVDYLSAADGGGGFVWILSKCLPGHLAIAHAAAGVVSWDHAADDSVYITITAGADITDLDVTNWPAPVGNVESKRVRIIATAAINLDLNPDAEFDTIGAYPASLAIGEVAIFNLENWPA